MKKKLGMRMTGVWIRHDISGVTPPELLAWGHRKHRSKKAKGKKRYMSQKEARRMLKEKRAIIEKKYQ